MSEGQNPASAAAPGAEPGKPGRKRGSGGRVRRVLLVLLALLVIFHRPILIAVLHTAAVEAAKQQNIRLTLDIEGTIFTRISLKNIRAVPNGSGPTPVENISIQEVTVHYSIPYLLRKGVSEFLRSYTLRNAYVVVKPVEGSAEQKTDLASALHDLIQQPALFSDRVTIDNLNLEAHVPDGEFALEGLTLTLDPVLPGALDIARLQVPRVRTWTNLHATSSYANRDMILRGIEFDPQIIVDKFELDASQRSQGVNRLYAEGAVFGGSADFSLLVRELPGRHENNVSNALAQIDSTARGLSLERLSRYFGVSAPAVGSVTGAAVHLTGDPNTPSSWTGSITADAGTVHAGPAALDRANTRLDVSKGWATFGSTLFSGSNSVTVRADGKLPDSLDGFAGASIDGWVDITGNDLHHFCADFAGGRVSGDGTFGVRDNTLRTSLGLKAAGISGDVLELSEGDARGQVVLRVGDGKNGNYAMAEMTAHGKDVRVGDYAIDSAEAQVSTKDGVGWIAKIAARRARDTIGVSGTFTLPHDISSWDAAPGSLRFSLRAPSMAAFNAEPNLEGPDGNFQADGTLTNGPGGYAGSVTANGSELRMRDFTADSLKLEWQGKGDLSTLKSTGNLQFALENGKARDVRAVNANISGSYSPEKVDFPIFSVTSSKGDFSAVIEARNNVLRVNEIAVKQAGRSLLSGSLAIPLDLQTPARPETLIPTNGPVVADLVTSDIALDSFFPKGQAPATGTARASITARGTIDQPNVRVIVTGRGLQARAAATLAPATLDADFTLLGSRLSLKARVAQPLFSPVDIAGTIPMPLKEVLRKGKPDPQSPIQISIRAPRSSLAVITRLVPAVRFVQGNAEASVDVAGTIAKPLLSGAVLVDLPAVRLSDPDMPSVNGFHANLLFTGNRLTFQQFGGNLSGGRFDVSGSVLFNDLLNPTIDLHFVSHGDLLMRNEAVTVRADSDIRVAGPFAAASVTGDIGITKSRFFKEIEILPLELPGRPAPKPPAMPATTPSIDFPPLRDWKFALKIHTKDPFIIQGNLANGAAIIDLNAGGTGKAPTLDGTVRIENFVASLPFSKLHVTNGFVYFSKDDPFMPHLNIQAVSNLQDYNINVYIYGTAQDPKTVMTSEPPLPQEDIVALLATGATTSNLTNGNALAGRAAMLVLQQLYHKVFKSKPPQENESFVSRFKVDVGGVDPRTGQQGISSSFKLSEGFYIIGDLDVGGDIRGMVRYLLRFK